MARASKGEQWEKSKSPFATTLRLLMDTQPITTQAQLAEITGKTRQTISQYVNGVSEPGYDTLVKIADHFHVSLDYLLGRSDVASIDLSVQDIHRKTGLSEENVTRLMKKESCTSGLSYADFVNMCLDATFLSRVNFIMLVQAKTSKMEYEMKKTDSSSDIPFSKDEYIEMVKAMNAADKQAQEIGCKLLSYDDSIKFYAREIANDIEQYLLGVFSNGND